MHGSDLFDSRQMDMTVILRTEDFKRNAPVLEPHKSSNQETSAPAEGTAWLQKVGGELPGDLEHIAHEAHSPPTSKKLLALMYGTAPAFDVPRKVSTVRSQMLAWACT